MINICVHLLYSKYQAIPDWQEKVRSVLYELIETEQRCLQRATLTLKNEKLFIRTDLDILRLVNRNRYFNYTNKTTFRKVVEKLVRLATERIKKDNWEIKPQELRI